MRGSNTLSVVLFMIIVAALIKFVVLYAITWLVFWTFGPEIFGVTFSWKVVLGVWALGFLIGSIFRK
jgi:hypothetical protein